MSYQGINIFSGEKGIGGALTNPTELSFRKGNIVSHYPVHYRGMRYKDVETAYIKLKVGLERVDDEIMVELIACKLDQNPRLMVEIKKRGGVAWLQQCQHFTYAKTESFQSWEGKGKESRFIRNLIDGYRLAITGDVPREMEPEQQPLFEA